ncbi:hypothetical protein [Butyrivibrio sp. NC3005]|uniref:hypothetical protein n=1 Tax=Butyrivibrio sp. NC3005 TaxID=1280685 RepID=UPI0004115F67|nr:hypothetical protein [Butyrivibrio sp. NC3005]
MSGKLTAAIGQTKKVLVGLGNEWKLKDSYIENDELYGKAFKAIKDKSDYLVPFFKKFYLERREDPRKEAFERLNSMLSDKDYFVISTLDDVEISKFGFVEEKTVFPCGNIRYLQKKHDANGVLINTELSNEYKELVQKFDDFVENKINLDSFSPLMYENDELILNQKSAREIDVKYNESAYLPSWKKYNEWIASTLSQDLLILELGTNLEYPALIRFPFERIAYFNKKAYMIRVNETLYQLTPEIVNKAVSVPVNSVKYVLQENE